MDGPVNRDFARYEQNFSLTVPLITGVVCMFLQAFITIPVLQIIQNSVLDFVSIKAQAGKGDVEATAMLDRYGTENPAVPTSLIQSTTDTSRKKIANPILAIIATLVVLVLGLVFLTVGLEYCGVDLSEANLIPSDVRSIFFLFIAICIAMILMRRKIITESKTFKARWIVATLIVSFIVMSLLEFGLPALGIESEFEQIIYAALMFGAVMLVISIVNRKKVGIAVSSLLVVSLIGAAICYRSNDIANWIDIAECRQQAEQGDADAQYTFGYCYYYGAGIPKDDNEAVKWLSLAAEQGQIDALYQLGLCYFLGAGVLRNEEEAIRIYWLAAQRGHIGAAFLLQKLELENLEEYRRMKMRTNYGSTHIRNGKPFDIVLPEMDGSTDPLPDQLPRLSRNGIFDAFDIMHNYEEYADFPYPTVRPLGPDGICYYNPRHDVLCVSPNCTQFSFDHELGRKLRYEFIRKLMQETEEIRKEAEKGDAEAQLRLGQRYLFGDGVPQDYAEAMKWLHKAADQENAAAQYEISVCHRRGESVPQSDAEAVKWCRKSAEQGWHPTPLSVLRL